MHRQPQAICILTNANRAFLEGLHRIAGMIRLSARLCVLLLCLLFGPGCASLGKRAGSKNVAATERATAEASRGPHLVGRIALVNESDRFVLIDAASAPATRLGAIWRAYTGDAISAELRATDVRRRPWVIADIVSGEPQKGDTVIQPGADGEGASPRAEIVSQEAVPQPPPKRLPFWKRWSGGGRLGH